MSLSRLSPVTLHDKTFIKEVDSNSDSETDAIPFTAPPAATSLAEKVKTFIGADAYDKRNEALSEWMKNDESIDEAERIIKTSVRHGAAAQVGLTAVAYPIWPGGGQRPLRLRFIL
jgi:hypothetical protein